MPECGEGAEQHLGKACLTMLASEKHAKTDVRFVLSMHLVRKSFASPPPPPPPLAIDSPSYAQRLFLTSYDVWHIKGTRFGHLSCSSLPPTHHRKMISTPLKFSLALLLCAASTQAASVSGRAVDDASASSSSSASVATSTSSASGASSTPGFVNNGTVGSYPCVVGTGSNNQVPFLSDTYASSCADALQPVYPYNKINIRAPDDSVRASFIPYGASLIEFWVKDNTGTWRDIVVGFDNSTNYGTDTIHPFLGPTVGRYANRIKNGTFELDGKTYHTPLNENNFDTLHGGTVGYDRDPYTVESLNSSHISFVHYDPNGNQGFPGAVQQRSSYTLKNGGKFDIQLTANVSQHKSPVMLSSHVYWALHGYKDVNNTILNHTVHMPHADKYIKTDGKLIPTGPIPSVRNTPFDFQTPRTFAQRFNETVGVCGDGCQGWDSCFVMSEHKRNANVLTLSSPETGIQMSVKTDQDAIQLYTCDGISAPSTKGSLPRKRVHGGDGTLDKIYENHSCVVVEMEDYIDGINNPEWGRNQIYSKDRPYVWQAEYTFSANS